MYLIAMMDLKTITYIQSETEFNRAKNKGFWETMFNLALGRRSHPLPLDNMIKGLSFEQTTYLGLQDIALKNIIGSVGHRHDFTQHFSPSAGYEHSKERWRMIYTLAVSGAGFPPIEVYQVGPVYFVQNGHHRVSVASYLGWQTIQAYVTILSRSEYFVGQPY